MIPHLDCLIIGFHQQLPHQQTHLVNLESMDLDHFICSLYIWICNNIYQTKGTSCKCYMTCNNQFYSNNLNKEMCRQHIYLILALTLINMMRRRNIFHFKVTILYQCNYNNNFYLKSCRLDMSCCRMIYNIS